MSETPMSSTDGRRERILDIVRSARVDAIAGREQAEHFVDRILAALDEGTEVRKLAHATRWSLLATEAMHLNLASLDSQDQQFGLRLIEIMAIIEKQEPVGARDPGAPS